MRHPVRQLFKSHDHAAAGQAQQLGRRHRCRAKVSPIILCRAAGMVMFEAEETAMLSAAGDRARAALMLAAILFSPGCGPGGASGT